jgi:ABC-type amino acid transport substrate-binding protein
MFLIKRRLVVRPLLLGGLAALLVLGVPAALKLSGAVMDRVIAYEYRGYQEFVNRGLVSREVPVRSVDYKPGLPPLAAPTSRLARVADSGWLRVGYSPDALPWAFRNDDGDLVGFDMELLHRLALEMQVGIETVRLEDEEVADALSSGQIDVYASGMLIDPVRAMELRFSRPYLQVSLGLLVEDHRRDDFEDLDQLVSRDDVRLAVVDSPTLLRALELARPAQEPVPLDSPRPFLRGEAPEIDALVMSAEAASAWTLVYPRFSSVIPTPSELAMPVAFALPLGDDMFAGFIDNWIQASRSLGVVDAAYEHWILGRETSERQPRWSIVRDVLHWVD